VTPKGSLTGHFTAIALVARARDKGLRNLHTAEVTGSIPVAPTNRKPLSPTRKPYVASAFAFPDPPVLMR